MLISENTPSEYVEHLESHGIDHLVAGEEKVDMGKVLAILEMRYGVERARVDSGGELNGVLLRAGLVDEVSVIIHPCVVGASNDNYFLKEPGPLPEEAVLRLTLAHMERRGDLIWARYDVIGS